MVEQPFQGPILYDRGLGITAEVLNGLEETWLATLNRLRIMVTNEPDEDGVLRGFGMPLNHPQVVQVRSMCDALSDLAKTQTKVLEKSMKAHPLAFWIESSIGIGWKQGARLLAATGDPFWNVLHGRPRTVSELWAYSGMHTVPLAAEASGNPDQPPHEEPGSPVRVAARRRRGVRSNWSSNAKMRVYLCAVSCIKQRHSPYRDVYDKRRAHTAETHPDWTKAHSHNDGLRIAGKEILRDLWLAGREVYEKQGWILE